jgi:ABC-type glycerol-3-phosphate transport system substrate-binding protein
MKKVLAIVAVATLTACGGASTTATTDSTAVTVDSTVVATDSTTTGTATPTVEKELPESVK